MEKNKPYLTVLMPAYNTAPFISEAIESILTQSYPYFELLIIDDGSTDETLNIIRSYHDNRIRLITHEQNKGLKETLNEGISLASYELIARMDADDVSHPWRFEKQIAYMISHPDCALVDSWVKEIDRNSNYINTEGHYNRYAYYRLISECCIYHSSVMYRKTFVKLVEGYVLDHAEDYDLWWRLSRLYRIHTIEEPLLWYRLHDQNFSMVAKKEEYDASSEWIWDRNLRYYLGEDVSVPDRYKRCYRYDFEAILQKRNLKDIYSCIDLLSNICARLLLVENSNRNTDDIRFINSFKKEYIIKNIALQLPVLKMWRFLAHYRLLLQALKMTLKRIKL